MFGSVLQFTLFWNIHWALVDSDRPNRLYCPFASSHLSGWRFFDAPTCAAPPAALAQDAAFPSRKEGDSNDWERLFVVRKMVFVSITKARKKILRQVQFSRALGSSTCGWVCFVPIPNQPDPPGPSKPRDWWHRY